MAMISNIFLITCLNVASPVVPMNLVAIQIFQSHMNNVINNVKFDKWMKNGWSRAWQASSDIFLAYKNQLFCIYVMETTRI